MNNVFYIDAMAEDSGNTMEVGAKIYKYASVKIIDKIQM